MRLWLPPSTAAPGLPAKGGYPLCLSVLGLCSNFPKDFFLKVKKDLCTCTHPSSSNPKIKRIRNVNLLNP